jgi:biotin carboxyl carrier protein
VRFVCAGIAFLALSAAAAAALPPGLMDIRATIAGKVLEEGLVQAGDAVRDGDPVVWVRTAAGPAAAARASADGVVVEVLVRPGDVIRRPGTVVARLRPNR